MIFMFHLQAIEKNDVDSIIKSCNLPNIGNVKTGYEKLRSKLSDKAESLGILEENDKLRRYLSKNPDCIYPPLYGLWSRIDNFCLNIEKSRDAKFYRGTYMKKFAKYYIDAKMNKDKCKQKLMNYQP